MPNLVEILKMEFPSSNVDTKEISVEEVIKEIERLLEKIKCKKGRETVTAYSMEVVYQTQTEELIECIFRSGHVYKTEKGEGVYYAFKAPTGETLFAMVCAPRDICAFMEREYYLPGTFINLKKDPKKARLEQLRKYIAQAFAK